MTTQTWTIDDAELTVNDEDRFYHCDIEATLEREISLGHVQKRNLYGTITMPHPVPTAGYFDEDDIPQCVQIVAERENSTLCLDDVLFTDSPDHNVIEFVARDGTMEVESGEKRDERADEVSIKDRSIRILSALIGDIVSDDVDLRSIGVSREPEQIHRGMWDAGPTTLEIVYDNE